VSDPACSNWQYRWFLLDGSLSTIYACVFFGIAWLWRPTGRNVRFAMSEELAQVSGLNGSSPTLPTGGANLLPSYLLG
jgi:hypothetical protein